MRARRLVAVIVEFVIAVIMSFLFAQVAARLIESPDPLAYTIGTVGAYTLGIIVGVYFSAEILDISGNFWFLFIGALFSGIVIFAAYDFRATTSLGFQEAIIEFVTSITILGPALGTLAFNIGPKS